MLFIAKSAESLLELAKRNRKEDRGRVASGKPGRHHENYSLRLWAATSASIAAKLEFFVTYADSLFGTTGALDSPAEPPHSFSSPGRGELKFSACTGIGDR
ncbi:MAG: hypothetical protein AUH11_03105 [Acidobacteria bacterium 13_2_20CM_57_17]|nr:MAG: hypothetical protein AUH11_03105 [Acidobacteria bacterium 13_2_20CM_57_17]